MSIMQDSEREILAQLTKLEKEIQECEEVKKSITTKLKMLTKERENLQVKYTISKVRKNQVADWMDTQYTWSEKVKYELKYRFKFNSFRPSQLGAINASLHQKDVLVVMPTGGGKSLIYQMIAVVKGKLTVVISPLLALIEDQLSSLGKFDITAASINSSMTRPEKTEIQNKLKKKLIQIIFVTPELVANSSQFMNTLSKLHKEQFIAHFIIDEVHCCSQWGHDFRTDYKSLSLLKSQFSHVPVLGLTATATMNVLLDIKNMLCLPDPVIITAPFNRPNLIFRVVQNKPEDPKVFVETLIKTKFSKKCGIVYVATQKDSIDLANYLRKHNVKAAPYHAGLDTETKTSIQKKWFEDHYNVIVATIAFGMGIDKPDVKFVIHYSVPKSMEGLYQESGRAGRNGEEAECMVMFGLNEWLKCFAQAKTAIEEKNTISVLNYCMDLTTCRRTLLSKYFDEECRDDACNKMCDHCRIENKTLKRYNIQPCLKEIYTIFCKLTLLDVNLTYKKLIDYWYVTGPKKTRTPPPRFSKDYAEYIVGYLIQKKYLKIRRGYNLATCYGIIYSELETVPPDPIPMPFNDTLEGLAAMDDEGTPSTSRQKPVVADKEKNPAKRMRSK